MKEGLKFCVECAHKKHVFELARDENNVLYYYVYIDGRKYRTYHRSPSRRVKCSDCGRKSKGIYEPLSEKEIDGDKRRNE
ncbi:hypothetical protein ES705_29064 [subsurface metagenome]|jgi:ribosomal protein S27E